MKKINSHEDLEIWKKSIDLVKETYEVTKDFPPQEIYVLAAQMKRAALSVACNIAEGAGRRSYSEFLQFLYVSLGSLTELETQFIIARELGFLENIDKFRASVKLIRIMLSALIKKLGQNIP